MGVVRSAALINHTDLMAQANSFLKKRADISELHLTPSELYDAVAMMLSDPTVVAVPTAHSSNVNVITTKEPPSFHGVITTRMYSS
jgi:hypothetical protein